ncbi:MAG: hypothetical protein KJ804_06750 [Proteobacteria bacterium]|nr:hypothetical protein [Pseudomonadota bacterium]MBU1058000.1 hypothetical protein [Pseudomonadota bacterium]
MSEQTTQGNQNRKTENEIRIALTDGENVHENVRNITLMALSAGQLDGKKMREVVQAVVQGASVAAKEKDGKVKYSLREAMAGVDEALAKTAEASKLSIEEAAGRIKEFGSHDCKRALDELLVLEDMVLDVVTGLAKTSDGAARDVLGDLARHGRTRGTAAGKAAQKVFETLTRQLEQDVRRGVTSGADTALKVGEQLSQATAGFFEGTVEALNKTGSKRKEQ